MIPRDRVHTKRKTIVRILYIFVAILLGSLAAAIIVPLPPLKPYSPVVFDRHGEFINTYLASDGQWRLRTSPDEIPKRLKEIIIRKEDRYFYYHFGVNPFAIIRASVQNIFAGQRISGASTITMQVARMLEPKERTYGNKLIEIFRSLQMELRYSKNEILELYLSLLPLGGNIEGLQSASLLYYQSPLQRLNTAQLLDLILIPENPNRLRPDRNPGDLLKRRLRFGAALHAEGFLSRDDSMVIAATPAHRVRTSPPKFAPHFSLRVLKRNPGADHLMSSLDMQTQRTVEQLLKNHLRPWRMLGVRNGAAMVIDNRTMQIIAYAGSDDFNDSLNFGQVDAVTAVRSPGSTLKPFLYALQMDAGSLTPKSRLLDVPYDNNGFVVENYDNTYSGWVTAEEALRRSLNIPMIRLLQSAGVPALIEKLNVLGFRTVEAQKKQLGLSIIVGGCGVTLEELTNAYTVFPRNGRYSAVRYESSDTANSTEGLQIFSPSSMYMITDILSGIDRPDLPNNFESAKNLPSVAFKTGTSYGRRDAWCVGYSADYTVGVWIGNVTNIGAPDLAGRKSATPLLIDIFNSLKHGKRTVILSPPQDIAIRDVCAVSGKLPTEQCTHIVQDYYSNRHSLNDICTIDKEYFISPDGKEHYCPSCIGKNYRTVVMQDYPPELLNFYRITGKRVRTVPQHHPQCERTIGGKGPVILSPSDGMTYLFTERTQQLTFSAASGTDVHELVWYVDNIYVGKKRIDERMFISLPGGKHAVTCMDNKGRLSTVNFMITYL